MNIVCIKKCFTIHNQPYEIGQYYTYDYEDYIDGLDFKYYAIYIGSYDGNNVLMGYANSKFILDNFTSVFEYGSELKYVDQMYDFFMDYAIKLEKNFVC